MPYILQKNRKAMEAKIEVEKTCEYFSYMPIKEFAGNLNYLITKIVKKFIYRNGKKYFTFAVICGTLVCCVMEIYRRQIGPYEQKAIDRNGDLD